MDQFSESLGERGTASRPESDSVRANAAENTKPYKSNDLATILQLVLIAGVGSTFIALYVIWIGISGHHKRNVDTAALAALYAARQLSQIYVDSPSFGRIGLCDDPVEAAGTFSYAKPQIRVTGINTVYQTLAVDAKIARHLKQTVMLDLIEKDIAQTRKLERELTQRLHEAAEPDLMDATATEYTTPLYGTASTKPNNIYRDVYRMLAADKSSPDMSLIEVRLKLGRYKQGNAHPLWPTGDVRLIEPPDLFEPLKGGQAPYAVLVEAVFQTNSRNANDAVKTQSKKYCALISAAKPKPERSTLLISFPDGQPPVFDSAMSLLTTPSLNGTGDWQQTVGSEVPGRGNLAPTLQPVLPSMSASEAFSVALYHWLRRQGPEVDENKLYSLLNAKWNSSAATVSYEPESSTSETSDSKPNSCLAIDTGARQYAILNQTSPGGIGQSALSKLFKVYTGVVSSASQAVYPPNALPLYIDRSGKCNLSGREGYDEKFVNEYLKSVYDTNLASIETGAVSRMVIARASSAQTQLDQKIYIARQELNSVINRLNRLGRQNIPAKQGDAPNEVSRQKELAAEKIDTLKISIAALEEDRSSLKRSAQLAQLAINNANQVGTTTFELSAQAFKLCKDGIFKIEHPEASYLVSRKFVFKPCTKPVDESDFFKPESEISANSKLWLTKSFDVVTNIEKAALNPDVVVVEGRKYKDFAASPMLKQKAVAPVVFLTTDELFSKDTPRPMVTNFYPFSNIRIPTGELFYYCNDALKTGSAPAVSWSAVIRDLVATVGQSNNGRAIGDPAQSDQPEWCKTQGGCPGLACEFQLRTPLPVVRNPSETLLTNPVTNAQVQQIPPVPADML